VAAYEGGPARVGELVGRHEVRVVDEQRERERRGGDVLVVLVSKYYGCGSFGS
jgi:hypothetical protein